MSAAAHPDATPCQRPGPCLHPVHQLEQERAAKDARDREVAARSDFPAEILTGMSDPGER